MRKFSWLKPSTKSEVLAKHGLLCWYCGKTLTEQESLIPLEDGSWTVPVGCDFLLFDHVVPRSRGGSNEADNLVPACNSCNAGKGGRTLEEYRFLKARQKNVSNYIFWAEQPQKAMEAL